MSAVRDRFESRQDSGICTHAVCSSGIVEHCTRIVVCILSGCGATPTVYRLLPSTCTAEVLTTILAALRVRIAEQCTVAPALAIFATCTLTGHDAVCPGKVAVSVAAVRYGGSLDVLGWDRTLFQAGAGVGHDNTPCISH
jgi:hypothetical protein